MKGTKFFALIALCAVVLAGCGSDNKILPEDARVDAVYSQAFTDYLNANVHPKANEVDFIMWENELNGAPQSAYYKLISNGQVIVPWSPIGTHSDIALDGARFTYKDGKWTAYIASDGTDSIEFFEKSPGVYIEDFKDITKNF